MNATYPYDTIRKVWAVVWGDDVTQGRLSAPDQHRVRCPYHSDSHPSCDVNLKKNTFYCRSCDARGGLLDVVVLAKNARTRAEAADWLRAHGVVL